jgi:hypothetical protein
MFLAGLPGSPRDAKERKRRNLKDMKPHHLYFGKERAQWLILHEHISQASGS